MRPLAPARQVRTRKPAKHTQQIVLREDQIDSVEYSSLQNQYNVVTGVDKSEEKEYHLQAALAANSRACDKDAENEIPAPPAQESDNIDYDSLYSLTFEKPVTYIRFSQTVEDCTGCQYNMSTEDDAFLTAYNQKRSVQCSEDEFEKIMEIFGEVSEIQAPHAFVDGFVVTLDDMNLSLKQQLDERTLVFVKDIYEYWKARRQESNSHSLQPTLKFEKNQEKDDGDPYVCFRRRDARQTRKTRARDSQSTEKLRKLRKELEDGRNLLDMTYHREILKRDLLLVERGVFEKRIRFRETKIKLGIQGDDQDLINEKSQPQRRRESILQRQTGPPQLRGTSRPDGRSLESDLIQLSDEQEKKENKIRAEIEEKTKLHRNWNEAHIDLTREPLSPAHGQDSESGFRSVTTLYQLMTPPSSVILDSLDHSPLSHEYLEKSENFSQIFNSTPEEYRGKPAYRKRIGRGGRVWIDCRGISSPAKTTDPIILDRWKFDREDDDEQQVYDLDPYSISSLRFRSTIPLPPFLIPQRTRSEDSKTLTTSKNMGIDPEKPRTFATSQPLEEKPPD